jgi:hypothetical protein
METTKMAQDLCYVNILLHGLFFMEFNSSNLIVKAPRIDMHRYFIGNQGFLTEIPSSADPFDLDLSPSSSSGLQPGSINTFANHLSIPQFSKSATGVGDLTSSHRFSIKLPFPADIIPLRIGSLIDFKNAVVTSGTVAKNIINSCGTGGNDDFSLLTCLRYLKEPSFGSPPVVTHSFYAEHPYFPKTPGELNMTYIQAREMWQNKDEFDLQLTMGTIFPPLSPVCPPVHPGYGISSDDENTLAELLLNSPCSASRGTDVANCVQFGINP